jgi:hypothetical protein
MHLANVPMDDGIFLYLSGKYYLNLFFNWIYFCISTKITWKTGPYAYLPPDAHRLPLRSFFPPKRH